MTLIKSISGIRGTIGGKVSESLSPIDVVQFSAAYGNWIKSKNEGPYSVVIGRDARPSGPMIFKLVSATLNALGIDVLDLGLSTTPTVEMAVPHYEANGGIILTASHNPKDWNALKLLDKEGQFIDAEAGEWIVQHAENQDFNFEKVDRIGEVNKKRGFINKHIEAILDLDIVNREAITKRELKVVVDGVNSSGGVFVPMLLKTLGVKEVIEIHCTPSGRFPHNPEPLPEHLEDLIQAVKKHRADLGIVVDPDVDRLAFVCEDGEIFGEEYTLVAVSDYILQHKPGSTVSNMSSTRALRDITELAGQSYHSAAVGEVNVVAKMKEVGAIIGGEGNGGVIYPELHYGRDALVGIALFLSHLATQGVTCSGLRSRFPSYHISKNKISLTEGMNTDLILDEIARKYEKNEIHREDGVKVGFEKDWVHLRKSNTEPIIRIYSESDSETTANNLAKKFIDDIREIIREKKMS
ncbi:MAG TPA: phosphoglucosamine mutase [Flavobacteriales bacterium]|jgi:phosphomannomutase|nr:phosphoglucosamine mutase [Flavobacteriales bacterium]